MDTDSGSPPSSVEADTMTNREGPTNKRSHANVSDSDSIVGNGKDTKRIKIDTSSCTIDDSEALEFDQKPESDTRKDSDDEVGRTNGGSVQMPTTDTDLDMGNGLGPCHDSSSQIKTLDMGPMATVPTMDLLSPTKTNSSLRTSSLRSSSLSAADDKQLVHVLMKVINPATNKVLLDTTEFKSDSGTVAYFLKTHNVDVSLTEGGYGADVSGEVSPVASEALGPFRSAARQRLTKSSLGSTISRPSNASTLSRPSVNACQIVPRTGTVIRDSHRDGDAVERRTRPNEIPLLSSTRIGDEGEETGSKSNSRDVTKLVGQEVSQVSTPIAPEGSSTRSNSSVASTGSSSASVSSRRRNKRENEFTGIAAKNLDKFSDPSFVKSATLWGSISVGSAVFARWRDRVYYSGRIEKRGQNDTWAVYFEDDMHDVASETHILPIKILGVGTKTIYCPTEVFNLENAIVVGQRFIDGATDELEEVEYALISDKDGRVIISNRKNLTLAENYARELRSQYQVTITPKAADLSIENIVAGKRDRCARTEPTPSSQIRALVAKLDSTTKSKSEEAVETKQQDAVSTPTTSRKQVPATTSKNISASSSSTNASLGAESNGDEPSLVDPPTGEDEAPPIPTPQPPRKLSLADTDSNSSKDDGDNTQIFGGMYFFLTASGGMDPTGGYDKEELRKTIEEEGGVVFEGVGAEGRRRKNVFLISDNYARTVKYIYALAAGIPCISSNWITESFLQRKVLEHGPFELSAGVSLETGLVLPAHRHKPLKGFQVYVTSGSDELYQYWKPVLQAAGAIIPRKPNPKKGNADATVPSQTDVLVTDASCPGGVLQFARERNIPVVQPEWLVQTIIAGRKVPFEGHEKYTVSEVEGPLD